MTLEQRKHFEYVRDVMHGDEEKEDKFCDNNCVWTDHHPDCVRSNKPEPVGFVVDLYNGANTPSLPPTAMVAWLNDNPKIGQILYTTPPQPKEPEHEPVAWSAWIPVKKSMPTNGDLVLVAFKDFAYPDTAVWSSGKWSFGREYEDSQWDEVENPIVKWMPLPSVHDEYTSPPQRKPQFKEFIKWAGAQGYDCAQTCNSDTGEWICLNPMTADLWKAWQAAHGIKEQP